jgi:CheY-like chemotaxis protein
VQVNAPLGTSTPVESRVDDVRPVTVLYIEDEPDNVALVQRVFAGRADVRVVGAGTGLEGLELAAADPPDLVLLDLNLPDIPGEEVLARLRADPSTAIVPVVIASGEAAARTGVLLDRGASEVLPKPYDLRRLRGIVTGLVGGSAIGSAE